MGNASKWLKALMTLGLLLTFGASLNVNAGLFGFGSTSWKEVALQNDGSTILVSRSQSYSGRHEIGQPPPIKEQSLSFTLPGTDKTISWEDRTTEDIGHANFDLLALHVENGTPYLVTSPNLCISYNKWGRPNPPYVFFKYDGNAWQRIPLSEFPADLTNINLVIQGNEDDLTSQSPISPEGIRKLNSSFVQPEYHFILHEPTSGRYSNTSCMNLIYYKGAWVGPGKNSIGRMMRDGQCSSNDANMRIGCTPNTEHQDK